MLEEINYSDIKKYKKYITTDINKNSCLYFDKDLIHKIVFRSAEDYIDVLFLLDELNLEELVKLKKIIYDSGCIVGYSIKNYKEYKSLNKFKNRSFKLKKQDCIKLVNMYNNISNKGLSYRDFHLGNILLNPKTNDIKICDLDSLTLFKQGQEEQYSLLLLLQSILEYLYNMNNTYIKYLCNFKYNNNLSIEYILKVIDSIDCDVLKRDKNEIKEKLKYLIIE